MAEKSKTATQVFKLKSPKKGSVLFEGPSQDALFTSVYLMRGAAEKLLGTTDLDKVEQIEITVKAVA